MNAQESTQPWRRKNGFSTCFNKKQIATWAIHIIDAIYLAFFLAFLRLTDKPVIIVLGALAIFETFLFWFLFIFVQAVDPSGDSCTTPPLCFGRNSPGKGGSRYCAKCKKKVPGMDHHCSWLGTCIGDRNYVMFYLLLTTGMRLFAIQILLAIFCFIPKVQADLSMDSTAIYILAAILLLYSFVMFIRYINLIKFNIYLLWMGITTYDYLISMREKKINGKKILADRDTEVQGSPGENIQPS